MAQYLHDHGIRVTESEETNDLSGDYKICNVLLLFRNGDITNDVMYFIPRYP